MCMYEFHAPSIYNIYYIIYTYTVDIIRLSVILY